MKVVIDVNVLLQSIGRSSLFRPIWEAYLNEGFQLVVSTSVLLEYEEKIAEKTSSTVASNVLSLISEAINSTFVNIHYEWGAIKKDPDDNKYFDTAVSANADYIVTNDHHFNEVKKMEFPEIRIISAADFLSILKGPLV